MEKLEGAEIYKLPPPEKLSECARVFNQHLKGSDGLLGNVKERIAFKDGGMQRNDNSEEAPPQRFGAIENSGPDQQKIHFEIVPSKKDKKTFTVKASYEEKEKDEEASLDPKKKKVQYKKSENVIYEREMDYNNLLIFLAEKKLSPITQAEKKAQDETKKKSEPAKLPGRTRTAYSLSNIFSSVKNIYKGRETKRQDYKKQKDEDLMDVMVDKRGVYDITGKIAGFF